MTESTHHRICPLCEASCGLELKVRDGKAISIRGNDSNVFSAGYICPKGVALKDLHDDPDRLRTPLIKRGGEFVEASWDEAFAEIARRLPPLLAQHGRDAAAMADTHHYIRPGAEVFLLPGLVHTLFDEKLVRLGRIAPFVSGLATLGAAVQAFSA